MMRLWNKINFFENYFLVVVVLLGNLLFFYFSVMEAKLAEYRAKKKAETVASERKQKAWNLLTFKFLGSSSSTESDENTGKLF